MGTHVVRRFCKDCGQMRPFEKPKLNWILHLLLTIFTAGLWLLVVALLILDNAFKRFRCRECGKAKF
jgi:hypothetical protein